MNYLRCLLLVMVIFIAMPINGMLIAKGNTLQGVILMTIHVPFVVMCIRTMKGLTTMGESYD